ncbi:MAG: galactitol-1-phosphate 5-dehydrogenase [Candidatus Hydrogenedentes bacterium]|nr:galactitol-1-phosphate 5-dehydrogenase [Candidatus Hydrogenedentota bacterium]
MKALVLSDYMRFDYTEVPLPVCGPDEVMIAVKACGICGSDIHGMDGSTGRRRPPIIMGHEAAGDIAAMGSDVREWRIGDRVTFDSTISCGTCAFCIQDRVNLCNHRRVLGVSCEDYRQDGAFAGFVVVPSRILYRLPDTLSFEHAAMAEAVSVAAHAAGRIPVHPSDTVLVVGTGMIGLLVIQVLALTGCRIIAADIDRQRLEMARSFGAKDTVCTSDCNAHERILELTQRSGADVSFEVVGKDDTVRLAIESLRKGGTAVLVGNTSPEVSLPLQSTVTREISLLGSCASAGEYPQVLDWLATGAIRVDPLISAVAPLAEGAQWFSRLYAKEPSLMKVILRPDDESSTP